MALPKCDKKLLHMEDTIELFKVNIEKLSYVSFIFSYFSLLFVDFPNPISLML